MEEGQEISPQIKKSEVKSDAVNPEIITPYSKALYIESVARHPEKKQLFEASFKEISNQVVESFSTFESNGVTFPYAKVSVTPEIINSIRRSANQKPISYHEATPGSEGNTASEVRSTFCITAFQEANNPLAVEDMAVDEFFRNLNMVAQAMKKNEPIPKVDIYLFDLPTAFGGKITPEWLENMKHNGMSEYAKLYSKFIVSTIPGDPTERERYIDDLHIRLHGVSMDSLADEIFLQLPSELQRKTHRLLDNPSGVHTSNNFLRGAQVFAGVGIEGLGKNFLDPTAKNLNAARVPFVKYMHENKGVAYEDEEQTKLKKAAVTANAIQLFQGVKLHLGDPKGPSADKDPGNRDSFIRKGYKDPTTTGPINLANVFLRRNVFDRRTPMVVGHEGKSVKFSVNKSHIFFYENFDRWAKNLEYVISQT